MNKIKQKCSSAYCNIVKSYSDNKFLFLARAVLILFLLLLFLRRVFWTPDVLLVAVVALGILYGRTKELVFRFTPFLGMLLVYESMRSFADDLNKNVHFFEMINFDRWIAFGELPTVYLQRQWWDGHVGFLEFYLYFLYTLHFLIPLIVGLILWRYRTRLYWPFVWSIVGVSFAAFIAYIIFPAAPPWMAKDMGYIAEPLYRVSIDVWWALGVTNFSEVYANLSPNAVAAVPSLHSAYPLIATVFLFKAFGWRRCWWLVSYPISMWVGVVYLGEHYVFDILAAVVFVAAGLAAVKYGFVWWRKSRVDRKTVS